jgi:hypothetical protein
MRFLRHLAAVTLLVAVITALGLAWNHWAPATLIGSEPAPGPGFHLVAPPGKKPSGVIVRVTPGGTKPEVIDRHGQGVIGRSGVGAFSGLLEAGGLRILRHTVVIETALIAAIVIIDLVRRRARRARRRASLTPSQ